MQLKTLDLSGNTALINLSGLSSLTQLETLNLSGNKGVTDLSGLSGLMTLENLNLSDTGIASLADLAQLESLKTLDISNTGVTDLGGEQSVPQHLAKLTARDLELTSISALAKMVSAENFSAGSVILWDFTDSDLPETDDNKADVKTIKGKLGSKFIAPYVPNMSEEPTSRISPLFPAAPPAARMTATPYPSPLLPTSGAAPSPSAPAARKRATPSPSRSSPTTAASWTP